MKLPSVPELDQDKLPLYVLQSAPLWFVLVIVIASIFTPNYSHLSQAISELAAPGTPLGWFVQYIGFVPMAFAFILFGRFLSNRNPSPHLMATLFLATGLALLIAGIFPTDEFGRRITLSGKIHAAAGILLICIICLTPLAAALTLKKHNLRFISLIAAFVLALLFLFLPNGISPALIQLHKTVLADFFDFWYAHHGVSQRLIFGVYFVWLEVYLYNFARH